MLTRDVPIATDELEITVDHSGEGTLAQLRGRLGTDSSPALRDLLLPMLRKPSRDTVIVDLANVSYIDASGIATLIEGLKVARNHQIVLRLKGLQGRVLHLFQVTGVLALFEADGAARSKVS